MTTLRSELAVDEARAAARAGDFERALSLVDRDSAEGLDLRARMHAQRGEFAEARECWGKVSELSPEDPAAAEGLRALGSLPARRRPQVLAGSAVAVLFLLLAGGTAALLWPGDPVTPSGLTASPVVEVSPSVTPSATPSPSRTPPTDLAARLAVDGVVTAVQDDAVRVVFDDGLFSSGDQLAGGARPALDRVGKALKGTGATVTVVGHAVAVPGGRTSGGSRVALARAQVAAARLAGASGLPLTAFTLTSADQSDGPHKTAADNRTVTLLVTPATPG